MARTGHKNPIDPETGRPRRGRPPVVKPVDTLAGPQPTEEAVKAPRVEVAPLDPSQRETTSLREEWKRRHRGQQMLEVPEEYRRAYPDGDFCFARSTPDGISDYKSSYDYEVAKLPEGVSLPGQVDSTFKFHDVVLMVRPKWMRRAHEELNRERVLAQAGAANSSARQAEMEAARAAGGAVTFLHSEEHSDDPDDPNFLSERPSRLDGERAVRGTPRFSTGTRYVPGGIPQ